ncbi:MAG: GAF domain-containing protein, partial [Ktedonobacteraceae bacterium]|nr:GAF domain-containing protein [Ktedonobacteraceae bacterium]
MSIDSAPGRANQELRTISEALVRISRTVHEHAQKLEIAVEGRKVTQEAIVRLLTDSLLVSRSADLELGLLHRSLQRISATLPRSGSLTTGGTFEREREALNSNISSLQMQRDELETLSEIARMLNSTLEFDEVLSLVMDQVIEFVNAERGFLVLVNPDNREPEFTIARDKEKRTIPEHAFERAQISKQTVLRVIKTRVAELADDAQLDNALSAQESIMTFGIRSIMCAPLVVRDNCIGAVYVDSRVSANLFGPRHRDLLLAFCNQAAIAIDNARLFSDLHQAIQQVSEDKQYMDNIFGSIANGVITINSYGVITAFNDAAGHILGGLHTEQMLGLSYERALQPVKHLGLIEMLRSAPTQNEHGAIVNQSFEGEITGRGMVNLNFYVSALRNPDGAHIGMALVVDDRTALRRAEARAREIRTIFERFVHPKVVQQLIQDPAALKLGGETKEISVLFADIRGYTRLSERMAPEEVM